MPAVLQERLSEEADRAAEPTAHFIILDDDGQAVRKIDLPLVGMKLAEMVRHVQTATKISLIGTVVVGGEVVDSERELHRRVVEEGETYELPDP